MIKKYFYGQKGDGCLMNGEKAYEHKKYGVVKDPTRIGTRQIMDSLNFVGKPKLERVFL